MRTNMSGPILAAGLLAVLGLAGCTSMVVVPNEIFGASPGVAIQGDGYEIREDQPIRLPFVMAPARQDPDIIDRYDRYRRQGARAVRVVVPGQDEPLYGLLSIHKLPESARGPARRSLSVQVPQNYIAAASNGRVSVVFEPVQAGAEQYYGWILWMSDRPF